ncbi:hypothetical protein C1O63_0535 [Dehalococcoides mccartyi]|nr:hypothetical protein C1O63_0535 [Dehalococcoides mccartyi]
MDKAFFTVNLPEVTLTAPNLSTVFNIIGCLLMRENIS